MCVCELYSISIKGKLQTGDRILFVNGIDVKTIKNLDDFKENKIGKKLDKTMRLQVQHDKGQKISKGNCGVFNSLKK